MSNHKRKADKHTAVFGVLFREEELAELKQAAKEQGESAGNIVRRVVREFLASRKAA